MKKQDNNRSKRKKDGKEKPLTKEGFFKVLKRYSPLLILFFSGVVAPVSFLVFFVGPCFSVALVRRSGEGNTISFRSSFSLFAVGFIGLSVLFFRHFALLWAGV